jgi:alkyl sulfatase BDS1-like metallo-beta-lactamase superfamily hydrolase
MTPEMFFDYLAVHIDGVKAGHAKAVFNIDLGKDGGSTNWSWKTACLTTPPTSKRKMPTPPSR